MEHMLMLMLMKKVMVVGDVHGQYFDLLNILKRWRPDRNLLFLGDYVGEFWANQIKPNQINSNQIKSKSPKPVMSLGPVSTPCST